MKLRTIQWNIGAGRIRDKQDDASDSSLYTTESIEYLADFIDAIDPDIVTFQEAHVSENLNQIKSLASATGLENNFFDSYGVSHIDDAQGLCQGIISKYEITSHEFRLFKNPNLQISLAGKNFTTHDKGVSVAKINIGNEKLSMSTMHSIPFRKLGLDFESDVAKEILSDMSEKMRVSGFPAVIQGDFNINEPTLRSLMPKLFERGLSEITLNEPTTPRGRSYDHILYGGIKLVKYEIHSEVLTDHYPVVCEFQL
jgi:hypothetical protein